MNEYLLRIVVLYVSNAVSLTTLFIVGLRGLVISEKLKRLRHTADSYGWCLSPKICTDRGWGPQPTYRRWEVTNRRQPTERELAQTPGYRIDE